jgi:hypothetical protein
MICFDQDRRSLQPAAAAVEQQRQPAQSGADEECRLECRLSSAPESSAAASEKAPTAAKIDPMKWQRASHGPRA